MKCCNCGKKLSLVVILKGRGVCEVCKVSQEISKIYTALAVVSIFVIFLFISASIFFKIIMSLVVGNIYFLVSKTEKI